MPRIKNRDIPSIQTGRHLEVFEHAATCAFNAYEAISQDEFHVLIAADRDRLRKRAYVLHRELKALAIEANKYVTLAKVRK